MIRTIPLENLDCANCAAKLERAIAKLEGVQTVSVSFLTQKITLEAAEDAFDTLLPQIRKVCRKIEPDCRLLG